MSSFVEQVEEEVRQRINPSALDCLLEVDPPINPLKSQKIDTTSSGYRYYRKIQERLPDWWEQYNGKLDKYGNLRYGTIREFILSKVSSRGCKEYRYLLRMIGADQEPEKGKRREVPWLGDWERRRQTGFGILENMDKVKPLIQAIQNNVAAAESIRSAAPLHLTDVLIYEKTLQETLKVFAGRVFLPGDPLSDKNQKRFKAYTDMVEKIVLMKHKIIQEWIRVHGVNPMNPHEMADMVQLAGSIGGAAMLTGIAAGQRMGMSGPMGAVPQQVTEDAMLLAQHLTLHAHTFKKPLPVLEAVVIPPKEVEKKKEEKTNGKHTM